MLHALTPHELLPRVVVQMLNLDFTQLEQERVERARIDRGGVEGEDAECAKGLVEGAEDETVAFLVFGGVVALQARGGVAGEGVGEEGEDGVDVGCAEGGEGVCGC